MRLGSMHTTRKQPTTQANTVQKVSQDRKDRAKVVQIKVMLTVFFDYRGVVHYEFLPPGQTVNKEYYLSVVQRLREAIRKKRPELWADNSWFLHHDNAPSHTAFFEISFCQKFNYRIVSFHNRCIRLI